MYISSRRFVKNDCVSLVGVSLVGVSLVGESCRCSPGSTRSGPFAAISL